MSKRCNASDIQPDMNYISFLYDTLVLLLKTEYKIKYGVDFWPSYTIRHMTIEDVYYLLQHEMRPYSFEW